MIDMRNASHRPPPFFEWFYFHFVTSEGAAINLVLHETDILGRKAEPYLSMSILLPGQSPVYLRRDLRDEYDLLVSSHSCMSKTRSSLKTSRASPLTSPFLAKVISRAGSPSWLAPLAFQDGILYQDIITGRTSHWVVQVPHGSFTALLQLGDKTPSFEWDGLSGPSVGFNIAARICLRLGLGSL